MARHSRSASFFFNDTATTEIYTLSLHDALPISPVLTRQTTMWKAWVGFNASHSYGAILFGLVYGYLAVAHGSFLFQSPFLLLIGLCLLAGYVFLGKVYWFSVPFRGIVLSTVLYVASLVIGWA